MWWNHSQSYKKDDQQYSIQTVEWYTRWYWESNKMTKTFGLNAFHIAFFMLVDDKKWSNFNDFGRSVRESYGCYFFFLIDRTHFRHANTSSATDLKLKEKNILLIVFYVQHSSNMTKIILHNEKNESVCHN